MSQRTVQMRWLSRTHSRAGLTDHDASNAGSPYEEAPFAWPPLQEIAVDMRRSCTWKT